MIGADGLQYGPITLEQLRAWVHEGRVVHDTKILRSDTNNWLLASQYVELGLAQPPPVPVTAVPVASPPITATPALSQDHLIALRQIRVGASWFFVIAAFSAVNTLIAISHSGAFFLVGLGINIFTQNLVFNLIAAGFFALFGVFARKGHSWAFIVGMILYTLDALIFLKVQLWLPLAFHAYALFRLFMGLKASIELKSSRG